RNTGGNGDVVVNNAGDVTLVGEYRNDASGKELRLSTTNGNIDTSSANVQSSGGRHGFVAHGDTGRKNRVRNRGVGSGEVRVACPGGSHRRAGVTVAVNGGVSTPGGAVRMIAGPGPGINAASALFPGTNPPVATETADDIGMIQLNAPISTPGNIVLMTSAN